MVERDGGQGCRVSQRPGRGGAHGGGHLLRCASTTLIPTVHGPTTAGLHQQEGWKGSKVKEPTKKTHE